MYAGELQSNEPRPKELEHFFPPPAALEKYDFEAYAVSAFAHVRSRAKNIGKFLRFSKDPLREPLHRLAANHKANALQVSKDILTYLGAKEGNTRGKQSRDSFHELKAVLQLGIDFHEIRYEIYCQLLKQLRHLPEPMH